MPKKKAPKIAPRKKQSTVIEGYVLVNEGDNGKLKVLTSPISGQLYAYIRKSEAFNARKGYGFHLRKMVMTIKEFVK